MAIKTTESSPIEKPETTSRSFGYVFEMVLPEEFAEKERRAEADHQKLLRKVLLQIFILDTAIEFGLPRNLVTQEMIKFRSLASQSSDTYDEDDSLPMDAPLHLKRRSELIRLEREPLGVGNRIRRNTWSPMSNLEAEEEINVEKRRSIQYRGTVKKG